VCKDFVACPSRCNVSVRYTNPASGTNQALYTKLFCIEAVSPNEPINDLYESRIIQQQFGNGLGILRTGFRASFVGVSQIPASQNTVRRSELMKRTKKTINAV